MGIGLNCVHLMCGVINELGDLNVRADKRVLTLGVQDCYFDYDTIVAFFKRHGFSYREIARDKILYNDGFQYSDTLKKKYASNIHQTTLFEMLGFERDNILSMDVMDLENPTYVHDLNYPVPDSLHDSFDLIFDGGTCEHVFSMKDCFSNLIAMLRIGGMTFHAGPSDLINHGFYNFNAELFETVYRVNGCRVAFLKYIFIPFYYRAAMDSYYLSYDYRAVSTAMQPYFTMAMYGAFVKEQATPFRIPIQGELRPVETTQLTFADNGFPAGRWNRAGTLTGWLIAQTDKSVVLSFLTRALYQLSKGKRVDF